MNRRQFLSFCGAAAALVPLAPLLPLAPKPRAIWWTYKTDRYQRVDNVYVWSLGYKIDFAPINLGPGDSIRFTFDRKTDGQR